MRRKGRWNAAKSGSREMCHAMFCRPDLLADGLCQLILVRLSVRMGMFYASLSFTYHIFFFCAAENIILEASVQTTIDIISSHPPFLSPDAARHRGLL